MTRATELTFDGITQPITEWALDYGITRRLIASRLRWGWSVEKAITTPMSVKSDFRLPEMNPSRPCARRVPHTQGSARRKRLHHAGRSLTIAEWAADRGIHASTIRSRLTYGWSVAKAIDTPKLVGKPPSELRRYDYDGLSLTIPEWSRRLGVTEGRLYQRLRCFGSVAPTPYGRNVRRYEFDGHKLTLSEWAVRLGVTADALRGRLAAGHPLSVVFTSDRPAHHNSKLTTFAGETHSLLGWSRRLGIPHSTITNRLKAGWTVEAALTRPSRKHRVTTASPRAPGAPSELSTTSAMTGGHPSTHALT